MQYRRLGRSGLRVSSVSLGSWLTIGNTVEQSTSDDLVHAAFERGVNLFDTADVYNKGEGEIALGKAIRDLPRHRLVLASKCYFPMSDDANDRGLSRKHVVESVHKSLGRLGTDYLDLYQCHRPDDETPLEETAMAMDDLIRQGKVLYWGVSYWPADRIGRTVRMCHDNGWHAPISNQPPYSLLDRGIEDDVLPTCAELGVGQIVFSPLAQGVLTGKYRRGSRPDEGTRAASERVGHFVERFLTDANLAKVEELVALAGEVGHTPAQLALAWCLRLDAVASVIVGASKLDQLEDNLGAPDVDLGKDLAARIEAIFA